MKNKFIITFLFASILCVVVVAACNFFLDGDALYFKRYFGNESKAFNDPNTFALTDINIDERLLKKQMLFELSKQQKADCIFIGSSRSMLISSIYKTTPPHCENIINLAVPGAGIEDTIIMSYFVSRLTKDQQPNHIYVGLSHWSLRWGAEESWKVEKRNFSNAYNFFSGRKAKYEVLDLSLLVNLLSADYLMHSIQKFIENGYAFDSYPFRKISKHFEPDGGPTNSSILRDGSRVYSREQQEGHKHPIFWGTEDYKYTTESVDPEALNMLYNIAHYFQSRGVQVSFYAMPYHGANTKIGAPLSENISETNKSMKEFFKKSGFEFKGDFLLKNTNCNQKMLDFMHPDRSCIKKIMSSFKEKF